MLICLANHYKAKTSQLLYQKLTSWVQSENRFQIEAQNAVESGQFHSTNLKYSFKFKVQL